MVLSFMTLYAQNMEEPAHSSDYYFSTTVKGDIETVTGQLKKSLKAEGFSVVTEINMQETLAEKLDVEIMPYRILGVCNATYAYETMQKEENIGVFLPCKMVLKQVEDNMVEVVAVNPSVLIELVGNEELDEAASEVTERFEKIIKGL